VGTVTQICNNRSKQSQGLTFVPVAIPDSHLDLVQRPVLAVLSTVMADGQPQCTPVWCDVDGTNVQVNTMAEFQKAKNMRANPRVTLLAYELERPLRYLEIRGRVIEMTEEGAGAHLDRLTVAYTGMPKFFGDSVPAELEDKLTPTKIVIKPTRVRTEG
jgi:PPOX class probable F420-dependent enzyme